MLRSINSSLSAYLSVTYNAGFFDSYDVLDCNVVQAGLLMKVGAAAGGACGCCSLKRAELVSARQPLCRPWGARRQQPATAAPE